MRSLRRARLRRRIRAQAGEIFREQRGTGDLADRCVKEGRRRADRLFIHMRDVWGADTGSHPRVVSAVAGESISLVEADHRAVASELRSCIRPEIDLVAI